MFRHFPSKMGRRQIQKCIITNFLGILSKFSQTLIQIIFADRVCVVFSNLLFINLFTKIDELYNQHLTFFSLNYKVLLRIIVHFIDFVQKLFQQIVKKCCACVEQKKNCKGEKDVG
eukprot:TRINITY_DN1925_c0_g1_i3.p5 TRINITY_DN1925_c0_g1~~TRINITY_DN1925_c0_g1_i3.p5  ORF type:complete len:116 (+),score=1.46 TRINITY_DN1925_c0_g1_i3:2185-2532(+)